MLLPALKKQCSRCRYDILTMTTTAGSGHPTSSLSAVELMTTLYFKYLRLDTDHPDAVQNDRVIFSKGHATPLLYALFHIAGKISDTELSQYRQFGSVLEGHPTPRFPFVDIATGSLGQGLAVGLGEAIALEKQFGGALHDTPRVYVLLGDGELAEGSVWEAVMAAGFHKTQNLIALVDVNAQEQSGSTMEAWDTESYRKRFESFGWAVLVVDGHDLKMLDTAYQKALDFRGGPTVILAKTKKGNGISFLENKHGWHGKVLSDTQYKKAIAEFGAIDTSFEGIIKKPEHVAAPSGIMRDDAGAQSHVHYTKATTTREGFGKALVRLGSRDGHMVVIDGDLETSTYTRLFHEAFPQQFFEGHIAEQLMAGIAAGMAICGLHPVLSSYASFLSRAYDQFRMIAVSGIALLVNGSHGGVSVGPDGVSQMGLEDIALFRSLPHSVVVSPSDAVSAEKLTEVLFGYSGIAYIRTTRPTLPILYDDTIDFVIGGSVTHKEKGTGPLITIIATGVAVHEALTAKRELESRGASVRVIDCYSIKPIDETAIRMAAAISSKLIIVEDHYPEGGLGEAVFTVLTGSDPETRKYITPQLQIIHLSVGRQPVSGDGKILLRYEGIDATAIVHAVLT